MHHHISDTERFHQDVTDFVLANPDDPALVVSSCGVWYGVFLTYYYFQNFIPDLKRFLFAKLTGRSRSEFFTSAEYDSVRLHKNRIYSHKVLRVNYTTYDMRRAQDSINPRTHPDVMVQASDDGHPYWYCRIIGIFHCWASLTNSSTRLPPQKIEFLWVRWFQLDESAPGGMITRRLHRINFVPHNSADYMAFGFIDPQEVIRAVYIIGAFRFGQTSRYLPPSIARPKSEKNKDWRYCYVNM